MQVYNWHKIYSMLINNLPMPSAVVAAIRYDDKTSRLRVIFQSGSIYDYLCVPATVYEEMKRSTSKGDFLNKQIKPNYEFEKIR